MFPSAQTSKEDRKVCNKLSEFLVTETKGACSWPKSPTVCLVYKGRKSFWIQRLLKKFLRPHMSSDIIVRLSDISGDTGLSVS